LLQIFSVTLFEKIDLKQALTIEEYKTDTSQITKQLNLLRLIPLSQVAQYVVRGSGAAVVCGGRARALRG